MSERRKAFLESIKPTNQKKQTEEIDYSQVMSAYRLGILNEDFAERVARNNRLNEQASGVEK